MLKTLTQIIILMRWNKPAAAGLLIWTCWWGVLAGSAITSKHIPWSILCIFALCAFLLRSAGCLINDIIDRSLDRSVKRTSSRPLASGTVRLPLALVVLVIVCICAFILGLMALGWHLALWLALLSFPLFLAYPYTKYITPCPQVFLGIVFNWSIVVGFASLAPTQMLSPVLLCLFFAATFWTIGYDTIYACQDREEDLLAGVRSLALGEYWRVKTIVSFCYVISFLLFLVAFVLLENVPTTIVLLCLVGAHFLFQILALEVDNKNICWDLFCSNNVIGFLVFLGLMIQNYKTFF